MGEPGGYPIRQPPGFPSQRAGPNPISFPTLSPIIRARPFALPRSAPGAYSKSSHAAAITSRGSAPSALKAATSEPSSLSR